MKSYGAMATFGPGKKNYRSRIAINIAQSLKQKTLCPVIKEVGRKYTLRTNHLQKCPRPVNSVLKKVPGSNLRKMC